MITILIISALCFFLAVCAKLLILKYQSSIDRASLFKLCNLFFLLITIIVNTVIHSSDMISFLTSIALSFMSYACLYILYTPFYYTISHSVSIRTMRRLYEQDKNSTNLATISSPFTSREFLENRLYSMTKNNFLICDCLKYQLTSKGKKVAIVFSALKKIWKLGSGG